MKKVCFAVPALLAAVLSMVTACKEHTTTATAVPVYQNDSIPFYPVTAFLQSQISQVAGTPYYIYQVTTHHNGQRDSVALNRQQFLAATAVFTAYPFGDTAVKKYYKEEVFGDQTTNSITLNYSTRNDTLPVQSATVLLHPETQKVKRIMMEVTQYSGDSSITYKLGWKANESCSVITIVHKKNSPEQHTQTAIVWNGN